MRLIRQRRTRLRLTPRRIAGNILLQRMAEFMNNYLPFNRGQHCPVRSALRLARMQVTISCYPGEASSSDEDHHHIQHATDDGLPDQPPDRGSSDDESGGNHEAGGAGDAGIQASGN